ncbi:MAG: hypothetical protein ACYC9S_11635, partial [Leptospirales bacterium]
PYPSALLLRCGFHLVGESVSHRKSNGKRAFFVSSHFYIGIRALLKKPLPIKALPSSKVVIQQLPEDLDPPTRGIDNKSISS